MNWTSAHAGLRSVTEPGGTIPHPPPILASAMRRLSRLLAFALLAWLPLQAAALPALVLACELDPAHSPMHVGMHDADAAAHHAHGDHAHGGDDGAHSHDGTPGHGGSGHGCCHHFSTAAPALVVGAPEPAHAIFLTAVIAVHDFFPEQPKRPPLAVL